MTDFEALKQVSVDLVDGATKDVAEVAKKARTIMEIDLNNALCDNPADVVRTYAATLRDLYTTLNLIVDYPVKLLALANAFEED